MDPSASTRVELCVHELFEAQAHRSPDAMAIACGHRTLTYRELEDRANQLAHHLRSRGVGLGSRVGVCLERSAETVIGMLAVLKAGAGYVPLDPDYPAFRLEFMCADAQIDVLLTQESLLPTLPQGAWRCVLADTEQDQIASQPTRLPSSTAIPDGLAYIIYTSGSTGQPKGVAVSHSSLSTYLRALSSVTGLGSGHRVLQTAPISFDPSIREILGALLAGATLVVAPRQSIIDDRQFWELISANRITAVLALLGSRLAGLASALSELERPTSLKLLLVSAERPASDDCRLLKQRLGCRILNQYGVTEATMTATSYEYDGSLPADGIVPIGRPLPNARVYILDEHGDRVLTGRPGELCIAGKGLAWGYYRRPRLTAERFTPDPFSSTPGARIYRTGDLGRSQPNTTLEYLGRVDRQVKIRGFRVEPGEVEASLDQHPAVRETVTVAREDTPGDRRLVAYILLRRNIEATRLRAFLARRLPEYMIPSAFVILDAFPLSPNGKVDRSALPPPEGKRSVMRGGKPDLPKTAIEKALAGIWAEVLGLEQVGLSDNFFDLGGHSLMANQILARVHDTLDTVVALRALFDHPTVAGLAKEVESVRRRARV